MSVFISHVEEDQKTAEEIGRELQAYGYEAWSYETSSLPGPTYLSQVVDAIEQASAMILVISPQALGSHQVAREVEMAHELDRPIMPVLKDITHEKFLQRRPEWRLALGASTSIALSSGGVSAIMPRVVGGLEALGVAPGEAVAASDSPSTEPAAGFRKALAGATRRPWNFVIAGGFVVVVASVVAVLLFTGGDSGEGATDGTQAPASVDAPDNSTSSSAPAAVASTAQVQATLDVEPTTVSGTDPIAISYSITNSSESDIEAATTEFAVLLGQDVTTTAVLLDDISQDIPAGSTVEGSLTPDVAGAELGPQTVALTMARRIAGGTEVPDVLAEVPITINP